jgi:hypothetical protein
MTSEESKDGSQNLPAGTEVTDSQVDGARREAIGRMGKFAAYTAPAMLAMLSGEVRAQGVSNR